MPRTDSGFLKQEFKGEWLHVRAVYHRPFGKVPHGPIAFMAHFINGLGVFIVKELRVVHPIFGQVKMRIREMLAIVRLVVIVFLIAPTSGAFGQVLPGGHWKGWQSVFKYNCQKLGFDTSTTAHRQYLFYEGHEEGTWELSQIDYLDGEGKVLASVTSEPYVNRVLPKPDLEVSEKFISRLGRFSSEKQAEKIARKYHHHFYVDSHVFNMRFIDRAVLHPFLSDTGWYDLVDTHLIQYASRAQLNDSTFVQTIFFHLSSGQPTVDRHYIIDTVRIEKSSHRYYRSEYYVDSFSISRKGGSVHQKGGEGYYSAYPVTNSRPSLREGHGYFDHWKVVVENPNNQVDTIGEVQRATLGRGNYYSQLWNDFDTVYHRWVKDTYRVLHWTQRVKCGNEIKSGLAAALIDTQSLQNSKWKVVSRHVSIYQLNPVYYPAQRRLNYTQGLAGAPLHYVQCDSSISISYINQPLTNGRLLYQRKVDGKVEALASHQVIGGDTFFISCNLWKSRVQPNGEPADCGRLIDVVETSRQHHKGVYESCFACTAVANVEVDNRKIRITYGGEMIPGGKVHPMLVDRQTMIDFVEGRFGATAAQRHEQLWRQYQKDSGSGVITILVDPMKTGNWRKKVLVPVR